MWKTTALVLVAMGAWAVDNRLTEFNQRLDAFVKIRAQAATKVPASVKNSTATDIDQREIALGETIVKMRPDAQQGNVFTPSVQPFFAKLLKESMTGTGSAKARDTIKEGNPKVDKAPGEVTPVVKVNAVYPKNAPLSSMPPSLLLKLPKLPTGVEYRFVGRTLILRDRESNLIIDYLSEAVPAQ